MVDESHPRRTHHAVETDVATHYFEQACDRLGVPDDVRDVFRTPYRETAVQIPVRLADGDIHVFTGFRVQHSGARGPYKGGLRYHPDVTIDAVRGLAMMMTWKTAVANIPYGGAKGGVNVDVDSLGPGEEQRITRSFMDKIHKVLGPTRDIMAPDLNTDSRVMAWLMDEYGKLMGHTPAIVTGKPIELEGSRGRDAATGRGLTYLFREAAPKVGLSPADTTFAVMGFGKVGSWAARTLHQIGARMVAVSDVHGAIRHDDGIDPNALVEHVKQGGAVTDFPGAEQIDRDAVATVPCDVLIPAALGGMINEHNADKIQCRMLIEGANAPTTPVADEILNEKGVYVLPDVFANSGGVVVSYFEWVQNMQHVSWDEREVNDKLGTIMRRTFREVDHHARERKQSLRAAAFDIAVGRVIESARLRGYI